MDAGDLAGERAKLEGLRRRLGAHLAAYRRAACVSQPQLGLAVGRTRSAISKVEHGSRGMPDTLWTIVDEVCCAEGALVAEYSQLTQAEQDYRARHRVHHRQAQQAAAQGHTHTLSSVSPLAVRLDRAGPEVWPGMAVHGELAEELLAMVTRLVRSMGRRQAMQIAGWVLAAVGLSGLDADECTRVAQALETPGRVDAHVIENLAATLVHCKRLEDTLGPCEIIDTVIAQHGLVRRLLQAGCPDNLIKPLTLLDSTIASTIGTCLVNMDQPHTAKGYFEHARKAGHQAGHPASAAYAAANASFAAFLRHDTCSALDMAAVARSLAARTNDHQLRALAEQMAAAAYALDGQHQPCITSSGRAHEILAAVNGATSESPAYWVHHGTIDSQRSLFLCLLGKPAKAVDAASNAQDRFNRTFVGSYARCQVRLAHALTLDKEITEATRILSNASTQTNLSPRLIAELHTVRTHMQPWQNTPAVQTLDQQLYAQGLQYPSKNMAPGVT